VNEFVFVPLAVNEFVFVSLSWLYVQYIASLVLSYLSHMYLIFHDFWHFLCFSFLAFPGGPVSLTLSASSFNCNFGFGFTEKRKPNVFFLFFPSNKVANINEKIWQTIQAPVFSNATTLPIGLCVKFLSQSQCLLWESLMT